MDNKQKLLEVLKSKNNKTEKKEEIKEKKEEIKEEIVETVNNENMETSQFNSKDIFISSEVESLLNERIKLEYNNSQAYHALSVNADRLGFFGLKKLMHKQAHDEHEHASRLKEYITDMGGVAIIPMVEQMSFDIKSINEALSKALDLELETTKQYTILYKKLLEIGDFLTLTFIQWYLAEQREELTLFRNLLDRWESLGKSTPIIFDKELESYV